MNRTEICSVATWMTPRTLRKGGFQLFHDDELRSVWPIVMKKMIQHALSTPLSGFPLRNFLRREEYIPDTLPWTHVRYYWYQWCAEAEPFWKQLWSRLWPFEIECDTCHWTYFRHDDNTCTYCHDQYYFLPCGACHSKSTPNLFGLLKCS